MPQTSQSRRGGVRVPPARRRPGARRGEDDAAGTPADAARREKQRKLEDSQRRMLAERARAEREATRGPSCQVDVIYGRKSASGQAADFGRDLPLFRGPALRGLCRAVLGFGQLEGPPGAPREAVAAPQLPQHRAAPTPAAPTPAEPTPDDGPMPGPPANDDHIDDLRAHLEHLIINDRGAYINVRNAYSDMFAGVERYADEFAAL